MLRVAKKLTWGTVLMFFSVAALLNLCCCHAAWMQWSTRDQLVWAENDPDLAASPASCVSSWVQLAASSFGGLLVLDSFDGRFFKSF